MLAAEAGIPYSAFLEMGPDELMSVAMGNQRRDNRLAWLNGVYVMRAVCAAIAPLFTKRGNKPYMYPSKPDWDLAPKTDAEREQEIKNERMKTKLYLDNLVRAYEERENKAEP